MTRELVRTQDIAQRLGVSPSAVSNWRKRFVTFPRAQYLDSAGRGGLFVWEDVARWHATRCAEGSDVAITRIGQRLEPYAVTRP